MYTRRGDPSVLTFSLSLHQHHIYEFSLTLSYLFIRNNKPRKGVDRRERMKRESGPRGDDFITAE